MKRIYKFATGDEVPEGSIFLSTLVEEIKGKIDISNPPDSHSPFRLVWHYFLVEVKDEE